MSRVTDHGLCSSVNDIDLLPTRPYDGYTCYVTSDDEDAGFYVFNGTEYQKISLGGSASDGNDSVSDGTVSLTVYGSVNGQTNPLPADAAEGTLAYVGGSTHAAYIKTNNAWAKLGAASSTVVAPTAESTSAFPATPAAGQLAWCSDSTDKGLYVYDGEAWKKATIS